MADPAVIVERDEAILTVTLNRPEKKNAINCETMCRLVGSRAGAVIRRS